MSKEISPSLKGKFTRVCNQLNNIVSELRKEHPEAILLLNMPNGDLMLCTKPQEIGSGSVIIDEHAISRTIHHLDVTEDFVEYDSDAYVPA